MAAAARLARSRRVEATARAAARGAAGGRADRLVAGGRRRELHPSEKGGSATGSSPVDRGRSGSKYHLLTDGNGLPLAWTLTGANRNDGTQLLLVLEAIPRYAADRDVRNDGPSVSSPTAATTGSYYRRQLRAIGVTPLIARRKIEHGSGLGSWRWVVERTFAWLHQFHRLPRPLRTQRTTPPSPARPRLLADLLRTTPTLIIVQGPLRRQCARASGRRNTCVVCGSV